MLRTLLASLALGLLVLPIGLAACGGSADPAQKTDEGYAALGKGDYTGAMEAFDAALAKLQPADPQFVRAKMGSIEAWIQADPERAKTEFLALAKSQPEQIGSKEYIAVASKMTAAKKFSPAIDVLDAGNKAFTEDPKIKVALEELKNAAQKAGDPEALKKLGGLGYL